MDELEVIQTLRGELTELDHILAARAQLLEGFKGMGVNIVQEKAMKLRSQVRRVNRLLQLLGVTERKEGL